MERHLVLSDLHLGIKDASLNTPLIALALINYIYENGPWKTVIFNGDLLDLTMSSFQLAIEGGHSKHGDILGFRQFLNDLENIGTLNRKVNNWVYIPGNHDYQIWNLLAQEKVYIEPLGAGKRLDTQRFKMRNGVWKKGTAFISGVFPEPIRHKVSVAYPDHIIKAKSKRIIISHGHYLDAAQTVLKRGKDLAQGKAERQRAIEKMYVEAERLQLLSHTVTYASDIQRYMNYLLQTGRSARSFGIGIRDAIFRPGTTAAMAVSPFRWERINTDQLRAVEFYLKNFRGYRKPPDLFVFGHTHAQGERTTAKIPDKKRLFPEKEIRVHNTGGFIRKNRIAASFLRIDVSSEEHIRTIPVSIDDRGAILV